jgi:hypothetical protein
MKKNSVKPVIVTKTKENITGFLYVIKKSFIMCLSIAFNKKNN